MLGLRNAVNENHGDSITVVCPENCQPVHFEFNRPSIITMVGSIAQQLSTSNPFIRHSPPALEHEFSDKT